MFWYKAEIDFWYKAEKPMIFIEKIDDFHRKSMIFIKKTMIFMEKSKIFIENPWFPWFSSKKSKIFIENSWFSSKNHAFHWKINVFHRNFAYRKIDGEQVFWDAKYWFPRKIHDFHRKNVFSMYLCIANISQHSSKKMYSPFMFVNATFRNISMKTHGLLLDGEQVFFMIFIAFGMQIWCIFMVFRTERYTEIARCDENVSENSGKHSFF